MTQSEIEHRLAISGLTQEDQIEIVRIFDCLSNERKITLFDEWDSFIARTKLKREQINAERLILIIDPLESLIKNYDSLLTRMYEANTRGQLHNLQTNI